MPRGRPRKPFLKNKPAANKAKMQTNLLATSKTTGIQHEFGNIHGWEMIVKELEQRAMPQSTQLFGSIHFYKWLETQTINLSFCNITYEEIGYRYSHPNFGPLTVTGSIGHGGRFNVGGAQLEKNFPTLTMFGCLYLASSEECAKDEAVKPIGGHKLYKVKPNKPLRLWDLQKVISQLDYPNLLDLVKASHGEKIWAYQKFPTAPQILANTLKLIGGDGISFESTKLTGHRNIALFFKNDEESRASLTFEEMS